MIDFRHPGEQSAWNALTENPVFQYAVNVFQSVYTDLTAFAAMKSRNFLVTEDTLPRLYQLYRLAAARLGVTEPVPVYIETEYAIKIQTVGTDGDCAILISSACLEECSDEQLLALFGQELAHIRYQHLRVLNVNNMLDTILGLIPFVGTAASQTFQTLLLQWRQYAYYTADRGAAIAARSRDAVLENLSLAMGRKLNGAGVEAVLAQLREEEAPADRSVAAKAVLQLMMNSITVPFGVWRMRELCNWQISHMELLQLSESQPGSDNTAVDASKKTVEVLDTAAKGIYKGAVIAADAVRTGTGEVSAYLSENHPELVEGYQQVKLKAVGAMRTGFDGASAYVTEKRPEWEKGLAQAKEGYRELSKGVKDFLKRSKRE